jgi:UDP-N-acetylmuramoyl-L-alanyl-D-glutamate--2,6-diaminopimelate ligase
MSFRSSVKKLIPHGIFQSVEPFGHLMEAVFFNLINGFPARNLKVIGVTGTNGKTSTAFLIHSMMHDAGYKVGLMTTVGFGVEPPIQSQAQHVTNVSPSVLMKRLKQLKRQNVEWLVLETTSHALVQHRTWGVPYSVAVMTNITHEHLDYHKTFERYRDAKRKMFKLANRNKKGLRTGVINAEDPSAGLFASDIEKSITYGIKDGELRAVNINAKPSGNEFTAIDSIRGELKLQIKENLPGMFNVYNSLAVIGVGIAIGMKPEAIERGLAALEGVEGRMTRINEGQDFEVIVDYAHTPDSFEKLFKDLKPIVKGKLIVLFGSAGRRDEAKRAEQGGLAGKYADEVIVTEEDDRDIDGLEIMDQIAKGAESQGKTREKDLFLVHDRAAAIKFAVKRAGKDDVVLLLGKGHEKDILRNGPRAAELRHLQQDDHNPERVVEHPWNEIAAAHEALKNR